jgi:hypothetical protein
MLHGLYKRSTSKLGGFLGWLHFLFFLFFSFVFIILLRMATFDIPTTSTEKLEFELRFNLLLSSTTAAHPFVVS